MRIVVAVKPAPEAEAKIRPDPSGTRFDADGVRFVLAGYDESAVEQALLLKESSPGSTVRAISVGPAKRTEEVLRQAIALGCDAATAVELPAAESEDPVRVSAVLAEVLRTRPFDLLLMGKQSADEEDGVVALATGARLAIPAFGFVTDLKWDPGQSRFTFHRALDGGRESWSSPGPLAIGLQQAWNDPRTAKLPNILKSRKATIDRAVATPGDGGAARRTPSRFALPPPRTGAKMIDAKTPDEAAQTLVKLLREEAKVLT